jgi:hypothetical protein
MPKPTNEQWQNSKWDSKGNGTILAVKEELTRKHILCSNVVIEYMELGDLGFNSGPEIG